MDIYIFTESYKKTKKEYPCIERIAAETIIKQIENLNKKSRAAGTKAYFRNNRNTILRQYRISSEEKKGYTSLAGRYFSAMQKISKERSHTRETALVTSRTEETGQIAWTF